jgi:hypothetical protein
LLVEPDAEVMQGYPRRQPPSQSLKLVRTLPPEAEGVEELVINRLDDLRYPGNPPPKTLGPASLFGVALGRMDYLCPVVIEPAAMVFGAFKAFVGYINTREGRAHTDEVGVWIGPEVEERLSQRLLGRGGCPETKARNDSRWSDSSQKGEAFVAPYTVGPADLGLSGEPAIPPALGVWDGHGRTVQGLVSTFSGLSIICARCKAISSMRFA